MAIRHAVERTNAAFSDTTTTPTTKLYTKLPSDPDPVLRKESAAKLVKNTQAAP